MINIIYVFADVQFVRATISVYGMKQTNLVEHSERGNNIIIYSLFYSNFIDV